MSAPAEPLLLEGVRRQRRRRATLLAQPAAQRRHALESAMVELARRLARCHPGYARLYAGHELTLDTVPVLEKADLAEPEFAAEAGVTQAGAADFLARPFELGSRYDERRVLFTSSGSTGQRLLVPYDLVDLGSSLEAFRARAVEVDRPGARRMLYIGLLDRHNGGNAWMHHLGALMQVRLAHLFDDEGELYALVRRYQPDVVLTRPHLLHALGARAAAEGRPLPPTHLLSVGDALTEAAAGDIERLWGTRPHNSYSTVETGPLGYQEDPATPALTPYDDLSLLELVDEAGRPVREPGAPGRVVATTLYRSAFPLVRYAIGDVASWQDEQLTRLSFPAARSGLRLTVQPAGAAPIVLEDAQLAWPRQPGVREYQLRQTAPDRLLVRWTATAGADVAEVGERLRSALAGMLAHAGVPAGVRLDAEPVEVIAPDPGSGKVKRMVALPSRAEAVR